MFLTSTSDVIRLVTESAVSSIAVQASWVDNATGTYTPGRTNTEITTATTTTVVGSPAASTVRHLRSICISNTSASSCTVTVQHFDGTTAIDIEKLTLLPSETLLRDERGDWRHQTEYGCEYEGAGIATPSNWGLGITGTIAETLPRHICTEADISGIVTSGMLYLMPVYLKAGQVCTNISFHSSTTAAGTPTNQFFALYSRRFALLAQSANDTTTAWAANTLKTLALTSPYTVPVSDIYYVGIMVTATTVPTYKGAALGLQLSGAIQTLRGSSTTGLTTALPSPCSIPTGNTNALWAAIT